RSPGSQRAAGEDNGLELLGGGERVDGGGEGAIDKDPRNTRLRSAEADPADGRPCKGEGCLRARRHRDRGGPATPCSTRIMLSPTGGVGYGRICLFEAR